MKKFSIHRINFIFLLPLVVTVFIPALTRAQNGEILDTLTLSRIRQEALQHSRVPWIARTQMIPRKPMPKPEKFIFDGLAP